MGSSIICEKGILCCSHPGINAQKSDLFVPQISLKIKKKTTQKKIKSLKTYTLNKKLGLGRMTTEKIITNSFGYKDSGTMKLNARIKERWKYSSKYYNKLNTHSFVKVHKNNINEKAALSKTLTFDINKTYFPPPKEKESNTDEKTNKNNNNLNYNINSNINNGINVNYEFSEHLLDSTEEMNITNILLYHYLFHTASKNNLHYIISELREFNVENGTIIFYEGDIGSCVFIIKKGKVALSSEDSDNNIYLEDANIFGELVMVQDEDVKRSYTAKAETDLIIYTLDKTSFTNIEDNFVKLNNFEFNLFKYISEEEKVNLELLATSLEFKKGQTITDLKGLFWIKKGAISLYDLNDKEKDTYGPNEFIGIEKLSNEEDQKINVLEKMDKKINSKIIAKNDVLCTVIADFAFIEVFGINFKIKLYVSFLKETICLNKTFKTIFDCIEINDVAKIFDLKEYKKGELITNNESNIKKIGIIVVGEAFYEEEKKEKEKIIKNKKSIKDINIIGDELFHGKEQMNYTVESNHLIILECSFETFLEKVEIFGTTISKLVDELTSLYFFNGLNISKLIEISRNLTKIKSKKDEKIIKKGDIVELIYFILDGSVKFIENNNIFKEYHKGSSFGEILVFNGKPSFGEIIVSSEECTFYKMTKQFYFELLSDINLNKKAKKKLCLEDMEIFPSSLFYLETLHKTKSSNIYLVHNKIWVYIMKAIYIQNYYLSTASEGKVIPNILNEKYASKIIDNPFLVKYVKTLKNNSWCFFIEEYIPGLSLYELIQVAKPFGSVTLCTFYLSCFIVILDILKNLGIVHRDIKPENIIITKNGYPKLIDFSCCKKIDNNKTRTLIGTPLFIAPEVLKGGGYSYSCDYWSFGVLIYYLFYGEFPFGSFNSQPDKIYEEIMNKKLNINEYKNIKNNKNHQYELINELKEVIELLLNKNEEERMKNAEKIKEKKLFENIDFNKLKKMEIKAPFIPQLKKIDFNKEIKNIEKPFMEYRHEPSTRKNNKLYNQIIVINRDKKESFLDYHKNLMKWFESF